MRDLSIISRLTVLVSWLTVSGCSPSTCGPALCPLATYGLRAGDDSSVTWTFRGMSAQMTAGFVPYPPPDDRCSFTFNNGSIYRPVSDGGADTLIQGWFELSCGGGGHGRFDVVASDLGDPRSWSVGMFQVIAESKTVGIDYFPILATNGAVTTDCTTAFPAGMILTITVETAVGGAAPYPMLVTDDFERTFRVEFDTATATPSTISGPCNFAVTTNVSLQLAQTAADYAYNPNAPCAYD